MSSLVFPAASLFALVVACLGGVAGIRAVQRRRGPLLGDPAAISEATLAWYKRNQWRYWAVFLVVLGAITFGGSGLVFLGLIGSFGVLLVVLRSLARVGLGHRALVGSTCMMGLVLLGQMTLGSQAGAGDTHFVNPAATGLVLMVGGLAFVPLTLPRRPSGPHRWRRPVAVGLSGLVSLALVLGLGSWQLGPTLNPITPEQVRRHVEAFDSAPYSSVSWRRWAIEAQWALDAGLPIDLDRPRRLLGRGGEDADNGFVLGAAAGAGLIPADGYARLPDFEASLRRLVDDPYGLLARRPIISLQQEEWVIRGAIATGSLTDARRDLLVTRLNLTLDALSDDLYTVLIDARLIVRLLAALGRPVDHRRYRPLIHRDLREFHSREAGGFQRAGGFKHYRNASTGDIEDTEAAIDLMATFGVPDGLDLDSVRSFVRPAWSTMNDPYIAAVARFRLDRLPDAPPPTWWAMLHAERALIAAVALVLLCLYATLTSPRAAPAAEPAGPPDLGDHKV